MTKTMSFLDAVVDFLFAGLKKVMWAVVATAAGTALIVALIVILLFAVFGH